MVSSQETRLTLKESDGQKWSMGQTNRQASKAGMKEGEQTHIFAPDLLLAELDLDKRTHVSEELPPGPVFHTPVLLDVLLDAADRQILDLFGREGERNRDGEKRKTFVCGWLCGPSADRDLFLVLQRRRSLCAAEAVHRTRIPVIHGRPHVGRDPKAALQTNLRKRYVAVRGFMRSIADSSIQSNRAIFS